MRKHFAGNTDNHEKAEGMIDVNGNMNGHADEEVDVCAEPYELPSHLCRLEACGRGTAAALMARLGSRRHWGPLYLFLYPLSGSLTFTCGHQSWSLPEQHVCFIADAGLLRLLPVHEEQSRDLLFLLASGDPVQSCWERFSRYFGPACPLNRDEAPIRLLEQLEQSGKASGLLNRAYYYSARLYEWLLAVEQAAHEEQHRRLSLHARLQQIIGHMEGRLHAPLDLEEMAAKAGLSKHHFCKAFKQLTGEPPAHYMRSLRVKEAARLLRHTDMPVSRVAAMTGFDNLSYFGKVFRRMTGDSPSSYRGEGAKS